MKTFFVLLIAMCFTIGSSAQSVPSGMNFQAVARNPSGQVLSNLELSVKINLLSISSTSSMLYYSETHAVTTNQIGLFSLVIGQGNVTTGALTLVPWSTEQVFIELSIKEKNQVNYAIVDTSKLLTVPYAFHSGTANSTTSNSVTRVTAGSNVNVTGAGTTANPYVVNAAGSGASPLSLVLASGNTTTGKVIFQQNNDNFFEVQPTNSNDGLKQGNFSMAVQEFPGVNGAGVRSNVVGSFWGYNTTPGGGQRIPGEASYRFAGETHYITTSYPGITAPSFEFHLPEVYTSSGTGIRPFSMYIDKATGLGSANYQMHNFNFKTVADSRVDWMTIKLVDDNVKIEMVPQSNVATSSIKMFDGLGRASEIVSSGGLSFTVSSGNFNFNSNMYVGGLISGGTLRGVCTNPDVNLMAHSLHGLSINRTLLTVGDELVQELFAVKPSATINIKPFVELSHMEVAGNIKPYGGQELVMEYNLASNNAGVSFMNSPGGQVTTRVSPNGLYAKAITTDPPSGSSGAGMLKVGKVVSATVTAVTNKYLQIEIDGVSYKLALVE